MAVFLESKWHGHYYVREGGRMARLRNIAMVIICVSLLVSCSTTASTGNGTLPNHRIYTEEGLLSLHFFGLHELGIKNGESTLIITPKGKTILVDAGYARDHALVSTLIRNTGATHLDYVLFTHFHGDHTGDFERLSNDFSIGRLLLIDFPLLQGTSASLRQSILIEAEEKGIPYQYVVQSNQLEVEEGLYLFFLNPEESLSYDASVVDDRTRSVFENNHSLVFQLTYRDNTFLFAGDIYKETEYELIDRYGDLLKSDLLKVPHHGLSTSSSSLFLMSVQPQVNIVCSGEPTYSTLDSLRYRAQTLTTVAYGTIVVTSDGSELTIEAEHEDRTNGVYGQ